MSNIEFHTENVKMPAIRRALVRAWLQQVAAGYGRRTGHLGYMFCDDERILAVNRQFLGHDYYTDIITFDYSSPDTVSGDMYISIDTVRSNSVQYGHSYDEELHRVIVHGVLHLCGINDKGRGERAVMQAAEDRALAVLEEMKNKAI